VTRRTVKRTFLVNSSITLALQIRQHCCLVIISQSALLLPNCSLTLSGRQDCRRLLADANKQLGVRPTRETTRRRRTSPDCYQTGAAAGATWVATKLCGFETARSLPCFLPIGQEGFPIGHEHKKRAPQHHDERENGRKIPEHLRPRIMRPPIKIH
jgi:hypothetical protein